MQKPGKAFLRTGIIVALLIVIAIHLRRVAIDNPSGAMYTFMRSMIYIGLFVAWGLSLRRRILQMPVRRYLLAIAALIVLLLALRTARYVFVKDVDAARFIWYLYYLPMLFLALFGVLSVMSLGKSETYRLPSFTKLLYIPTTILLLLVLTNDWHQLVFAFPPEEAIWLDEYASYAAGYWFVYVWMMGCVLAAFVGLIIRSRSPESKKILWVPFVPLGIFFIYSVMYLTKVPWLYNLAGDMTVVLCLLIAAILESCIWCGLIQSNTHYKELFAISTVKAQIADENYNIYLSSGGVANLPKETMKQTEKAPVLLEGNIRLASAAISGGRVIWQEDISSLTQALEELEDANEFLLGKNVILAEGNKINRQRRRLAEQNRLYDSMQNQISEEIALLSTLVERFGQTESPQEEARLLHKIAMLGAYIKRRNNLIFLSDESHMLPLSELEHCIGESMQNLELAGIDCQYHTDGDGMVPFDALTKMYDVFQTVVAETFDDITALFVSVSIKSGAPKMKMRLSAMCESLPASAVAALDCEKEDEGEWRLMYAAEQGGERS